MATRILNDPKAREKPCLRCGYSLRSIPDARHCPECGLSVWLSLNEGDALDRSNPVWLRRLAIASWIIAAAHVLGLVEWAALSSIESRLRLAMHLGVSSFSLEAIAWSSYMIAFHFGMLLLASPEHRYPDRLKIDRRLLRFLGAAGMLLAALLMTMALPQIRPWRLYRFLYYLREWGAGLILLGGAAATLAYLRKLARRMPSAMVSKACGGMMIFPAVMGWAALPCIGTTLFWGGYGFVRLLPWGYLPAMTLLCAWFAIRFHRDARAAEREWSAETISAAA